MLVPNIDYYARHGVQCPRDLVVARRSDLAIRTGDADIVVIGAGLAGSEAAWQAAQRGMHVLLYEMRPNKPRPPIKAADFAELVCSNSFGSNAPDRALGLLKTELRRLDSLNIACADARALARRRRPGGGSRRIF